MFVIYRLAPFLQSQLLQTSSNLEGTDLITITHYSRIHENNTSAAEAYLLQNSHIPFLEAIMSNTIGAPIIWNPLAKKDFPPL
jgi:hypothetical protein